MDSHLQALSGGTVPVSDIEISALRGVLRGSVLLPGEAGYEAARTVWNAMVDRRPGIIVQALGAADVIQAINFAREHGASLAVRGGGHNIAGNAVCEGGIMLDLSRMRSVHIDPVSRRARVEGARCSRMWTRRLKRSVSRSLKVSTQQPASLGSRSAAASAGPAVN